MSKYLWCAAIVAAFLAGFVYESTPELQKPLDPQAAAMRDRIEWVKTYQGQDNVKPPVDMPPYSVGRGVDVIEFTPATMPNHRCVFVSEVNESGLYCSDVYGGLNHARTN